MGLTETSPAQISEGTQHSTDELGLSTVNMVTASCRPTRAFTLTGMTGRERKWEGKKI
jgi:hypothetical protein